MGLVLFYRVSYRLFVGKQPDSPHFFTLLLREAITKYIFVIAYE